MPPITPESERLLAVLEFINGGPEGDSPTVFTKNYLTPEQLKQLGQAGAFILDKGDYYFVRAGTSKFYLETFEQNSRQEPAIPQNPVPKAETKKKGLPLHPILRAIAIGLISCAAATALYNRLIQQPTDSQPVVPTTASLPQQDITELSPPPPTLPTPVWKDTPPPLVPTEPPPLPDSTVESRLNNEILPHLIQITCTGPTGITAKIFAIPVNLPNDRGIQYIITPNCLIPLAGLQAISFEQPFSPTPPKPFVSMGEGISYNLHCTAGDLNRDFCAFPTYGRNYTQIEPDQFSGIVPNQTPESAFALGPNGLFHRYPLTGNTLPSETQPGPVADDHGEIVGISGIGKAVTFFDQANNLNDLMKQSVIPELSKYTK